MKKKTLLIILLILIFTGGLAVTSFYIGGKLAMFKRGYGETTQVESMTPSLSTETNYVPPYFARVDKIEPSIPNLVVDTYQTLSIFMENNTGQNVYLYNRKGEECYKITPSASYKKVNNFWQLENLSLIHI